MNIKHLKDYIDKQTTDICESNDSKSIPGFSREKLSELLDEYEKSNSDIRPLVVSKQIISPKRNWYDIVHSCPHCGTEIYSVMVEGEKAVGSSSILDNGQMPKFCPECGYPLKMP